MLDPFNTYHYEDDRYAEYRRELHRRSTAAQLRRAAQAARPTRPLYAPFMAWLGRRMALTGQRLQVRYSLAAARLAPRSPAEEDALSTL